MSETPGGFAGLLRALRTAAGLTQQELANAAGISLRRVNGLERGAAGVPQRETSRSTRRRARPGRRRPAAVRSGGASRALRRSATATGFPGSGLG